MTTLLAYRDAPVSIRCFGDSWEFLYILTLKKTYFFGLIKRVIEVNHTVSMFTDLKSLHAHWDKLIETQERLK